MNRLLLTLFLAIISYTSILSQTYRIPQQDVLIASESVPHASSVKIIYSAAYQGIVNAEYEFFYNWSDDFRQVEYETLWQNIKASFDDDGRLIKYIAKSKDYPYPVQQDDSYEYDVQGRVVCKFNALSKSEAFYTGTETDSIVSWDLDEFANVWHKISKQEVKYYDEYYEISHYSFDNEAHEYKYNFTTRYELDSDGRVVKIFDTDSSGGSIYEYSYTDNGYTLLISYYGSEHPIFKYDVVFNDNGDLLYELYSEWINDSYWKLCNQTYMDYEYSQDSVSELISDKVFAICGNIIHFKTDSWIEISTISGSNIFSGKCADKYITIPFNTICLIKSEGKVYKVISR